MNFEQSGDLDNTLCKSLPFYYVVNMDDHIMFIACGSKQFILLILTKTYLVHKYFV